MKAKHRKEVEGLEGELEKKSAGGCRGALLRSAHLSSMYCSELNELHSKLDATQAELESVKRKHRELEESTKAFEKERAHFAEIDAALQQARGKLREYEGENQRLQEQYNKARKERIRLHNEIEDMKVCGCCSDLHIRRDSSLLTGQDSRLLPRASVYEL